MAKDAARRAAGGTRSLVAGPRRLVLADGTYDAIRAMILDHEISPGEHVGIDELARDLGVSQTPVREAPSMPSKSYRNAEFYTSVSLKLARVMPLTFVTFACGYLAIIGFPGATGFWTKDKIIEAAFDKGGTSGYILGICALLGAGITAFYMTRALVMTFLGKRRWEDDVHPHEASLVMTIPMMVLGLLALVGGYLLIFGGFLLKPWWGVHVPLSPGGGESGHAHGASAPTTTWSS